MVTNNEPLVSICIPVYNSERYLWETILSAVNQTYNNKEIVILDNASTDSTLKIINKAVDKFGDVVNLRVFRNPKNIGLVENWLQCVKYSYGRYISFFSSDDIYDTRFIENAISFSTENDIDIVSARYTSNYHIFKFALLKNKKNYKLKHRDAMLEIVKNNFINISSSLISRYLLDKLKFDLSLPLIFDYDFHIRAILSGYNIGILNNVINFRRIHKGQVSYKENWCKDYFKLFIKHKNSFSGVYKSIFIVNMMNNILNYCGYDHKYRNLMKQNLYTMPKNGLFIKYYLIYLYRSILRKR